MNKVILMGRLVKNPEVRQDANGAISMARYTLAVDRMRTKKDEDPGADFINCVVFSKSAEFAKNYLRKGSKIVIEGRIQTGSYTNKDGNKVYTTDVVVEEQEFAESKAAGGQPSGGGYQPAGRPAPGNAGAEGFMSIPEGIEDDLPFK